MLDGDCQERRIIHLEAARGIASIIVVFHHFTFGFWPSLREPYPQGLGGTPFFWIINGEAAVKFFFVLSGFVLVLKFYRAPSAVNIAIAALKRLPRLIIPASLTVLAGWAILRFGFHWNEPAASITGSEWLKTFAYGMPPDARFLSFRSALHQCLAVFLVGTPYFYNSNLWTMSYEFYGSLLAFMMATLTMYRINNAFKACIMIAALLFFYFESLYYLTFVVGTSIALAMTTFHIPRLTNSLASILLTLASLACLSSTEILLQTVGSALLISTLLCSDKLARGMSGGTGKWLGKLSFPLYLVHVLVLLSLTSYVFTKAWAIWPSSVLPYGIAATVTLGASLIAAIPMMLLDSWWVGVVNKTARFMATRFRIIVRHPTGSHWG